MADGDSASLALDGGDVSPTALVVEDDALIAQSMELVLEDLGFRVVGMAATATDAVALARATRPDVILMDVILRGPGDGADAAAEILADVQTKVVFITGSNEKATLERLRACAGATILIKPVTPEDLEAALADVAGAGAPAGMDARS